MSTFMHSPDGDEEGEFPSTSSPLSGERESFPPKLPQETSKKRANRRPAKSRETPGDAAGQHSLSGYCSPTRGGDSPQPECNLPSPKLVTSSPEPTASSTRIDIHPPLDPQGLNAGNTSGSWLQRLIKKFELEPEDMEKLDRLDQFGSIFIRNGLRLMGLLFVAILVYALGIFAEKLRHERDLYGKFQNLIGDSKLLTTLIASATMFGTAAVGTAAVSHVRKMRQEKSRPKNEEKDNSPEFPEP